MDPIFGGLITGGANLLGSMFTSNTSAQNTQAQIAASEQQQATQNAFTQQMSNTAYQRASSDMKAAGLNPAMMFGSGSAASTPSGSSIQAPMPQTQSWGAGLGKAVSEGVNSAIAMKTIEKLQEEVSNLRADTAVKQVTPESVQAGTALKGQEFERGAATMPAFRAEGEKGKLTEEFIREHPNWIRAGLFGHAAEQVARPASAIAEGVAGVTGVSALRNALIKKFGNSGGQVTNSATSWRRGYDAAKAEE